MGEDRQGKRDTRTVNADTVQRCAAGALDEE